MSDRLGTNWHVKLKDKIKTVRSQLDLTQDEVADQSEGQLRRQDVVKLESGKNKASTDRIRKGLAISFGATREEIDELIEKDLAPEELALRIKARGVDHIANGSSEARSGAPRRVSRPKLPVVRKLNQLPEWPVLLAAAKILASQMEEDVWREVGEGHPTFREPPTPRLLVLLAQYVLETRPGSQASRRAPKKLSG
jgi:DNA-binding XRE family transcriptional regulator